MCCCTQFMGSVRQKRKCHVQMPHDVLFPFSLSAVAVVQFLLLCSSDAAIVAAICYSIGAIAHVVANENI